MKREEVIEIVQDIMTVAHAGYSDMNSKHLADLTKRDNKFKEDIRDMIGRLECKFDQHEEDTRELRNLDVSTLKDIVVSWKGVISIQSITKGFGAFILALGAIGAGLTWLISHLTIK